MHVTQAAGEGKSILSMAIRFNHLLILRSSVVLFMRFSLEKSSIKQIGTPNERIPGHNPSSEVFNIKIKLDRKSSARKFMALAEIRGKIGRLSTLKEMSETEGWEGTR